MHAVLDPVSVRHYFTPPWVQIGCWHHASLRTYAGDDEDDDEGVGDGDERRQQRRDGLRAEPSKRGQSAVKPWANRGQTAGKPRSSEDKENYQRRDGLRAGRSNGGQTAAKQRQKKENKSVKNWSKMVESGHQRVTEPFWGGT